MATELTLVGATSGSDVRALLFRRSDGKVYNVVTSTYDTYVLAGYSNYLIQLTETPAGSRRWLGDLPVGAVAPDHDALYLRLKTPGTPTVADDEMLGSEDLAITSGDGGRAVDREFDFTQREVILR